MGDYEEYNDTVARYEALKNGNIDRYNYLVAVNSAQNGYCTLEKYCELKTNYEENRDKTEKTLGRADWKEYDFDEVMLRARAEYY